VTTYNRAGVIERAPLKILRKKKADRGIYRRRAGLCRVPLHTLFPCGVLSLPLGIFAAFIIMKLQGVNANIMSLGGIAVLSAMVNARHCD
jgi:Cu(I)/Ag(I) efflux system membrane protein CusA/SilA